MIARPGAAPNAEPGALLSFGRNFTKARVIAIAWQGRPAVLKTVSHQPPWLRWLAGRRLLEREERAYRLLQGLPGVPALLSRPDEDSLVCERIVGRRLDQHRRRSLPPVLFDSLLRVLEGAHARGVAHGDVHRRDVLVTSGGAPWVVDWATSLTCGEARGRLRAALFRRWVEIDRRAVEKLRRRYAVVPQPGAGELEPGWAPHRWAWRLRRRLEVLWAARPIESGPRGGQGEAAELEPEGGGYRLAGRLRLAALYAGCGLLVALARPTEPWMAAGLCLMVPGEALRWWAAGHLLKSRELVTSGPYAYTQNPLYLGRLLILTGLALMCQVAWGLNWIALALGLGGFFGYYLPRKLRVEGARLSGRHGGSWRQYRESVPVLFPALRRYAGADRLPWSWRRLLRNREYLMVLALGGVVALLWSRLPG